MPLVGDLRLWDGEKAAEGVRRRKGDFRVHSGAGKFDQNFMPAP
jgi:hypothetical protein